MITLFLGGTCNNSKWRDRLCPLLSERIKPFNPVVKEWTHEAKLKEFEARKNSDFVLYVITPRMTGTYSIAEAVDDSNKRPEKTLFCVIDTEPDSDVRFTYDQRHSLLMVSQLITENGGKAFTSLEALAEFLNEQAKLKV